MRTHKFNFQIIKSSFVIFTHFGYDLCKGTTGLITNPDLLFGRQSGTNRLQFRVDGLVRKTLNGQLWFARGV